MSYTNDFIPIGQIFLRLAVAMVLGGLIGYRRELDAQPAGLRTHMILVAGSALAMILSINIAAAGNSDPTRLAAQVISGIGFLGAGAIMRYGLNIKGLTSASTIWSMAIVGLAVGYGYIWVGIGVSIMILAALSLVNLLEEKFLRTAFLRVVTIDAIDHPGTIEAIRAKLSDLVNKTQTFTVEKNVLEGRLRLRFSVVLPSSQAPEKFVEKISEVVGVQTVRLE